MEPKKSNLRGNFLTLSLMVALIINASCSSSKKNESSTNIGSEPSPAHLDATIHPAAYAADGFTFNKRQPKRSKGSTDFYYKHCTQDDGKSYYSKTSYECSVFPR